MAFLDQRTVAVVRTLLFFLLIAAFVYTARSTLLLLIFAIFFAYLIHPVVAWLERKQQLFGRSRSLAIAEVYLVLCGLCVGLVLWVWPAVVAEGQSLLAMAPALSDQATWTKLIRQISSNQGWSHHTQIQLERLVYQHRTVLLAFTQQVTSRVESVVANAIWLILIPILAVFLLHNGRDLADSSVRMLRLKPASRAFLDGALRDMNDMAAHYVRAQMVLAALSMALYTVVLVFSGLEYGLILGLLAGALDFIPVLGPLVGAVLIIGTGILTGFQYVWALVLFLGTWRILQDYVNSPRLMHRSIRLHPFAVIIAVLAGAEIGGVIGVFLSIPAAATLQIVWRRWRTSSLALETPAETAPAEQKVA